MSNHQNQIDVFIDGVKRYFEHLNDGPDSQIDIGVPYLVKNQDADNTDFTGVIAINGCSQGYVIFSAERSMLSKILVSYGETRLTHDYMCDLVGEISNTIAGNARKLLGEEFHISPPKTNTGKINSILLEKDRRSYVLPIRWQNNRAQLVVSLNN